MVRNSGRTPVCLLAARSFRPRASTWAAVSVAAGLKEARVIAGGGLGLPNGPGETSLVPGSSETQPAPRANKDSKPNSLARVMVVTSPGFREPPAERPKGGENTA